MIFSRKSIETLWDLCHILRAATAARSIIEASFMDAALSIAKACPFLDVAGSLEVSELIEMPG